MQYNSEAEKMKEAIILWYSAIKPHSDCFGKDFRMFLRIALIIIILEDLQKIIRKSEEKNVYLQSNTTKNKVRNNIIFLRLGS